MIGAMPAVAVRHERRKQQKRAKWSSSLAPLSISGLTMIGAMPAVAVRHERRKQEKRYKRPSHLGLQSPLSHTEPSPDAAQSPPNRAGMYPRQEFYVCGKVSLLHVVVVSLLIGAILVIVGLVQLTPGAADSQHRYLLLAAGGALLLIGVLLAAMRCCVLPWYARRHRPQSPATPAAPPVTGTTVAQSGPGGSQDNSVTGSGKDGPSSASSGRSRTNSTTNGQIGRPRGSLCSPTGNQRRRSITEAERGVGDGSARRESADNATNHHSELSVVNESSTDT